MIKTILKYGWVTALGCFMAYCLIGMIRDGRELRAWEEEQARLEKAVGNLDVDDTSKIQVLQVSDDGPSDILWRVALPAKQTWTFKYNTPVGGGGSSTWVSNNEDQQILVRSRIIKVDGQWTLFVARSQGSGSNSLVERVGEFITQHWDEFEISIAGSGQQASYAVDEIIPLLTVNVPAPLLPAVEKELGAWSAKKLETQPILQIEFGTNAAFQAFEQAKEVGTDG